jgi:hypothetical protein
MSVYTGTIIEESLKNTDVLKKVTITSTLVEPVNERHATPWLKQWTLHKVEIPEADAAAIADELSYALERDHTAWYADFKNDAHAYIIFPDKVFFIDRTNQAQYDETRQYGLSLGIPEYQVDFKAV